MDDTLKQIKSILIKVLVPFLFLYSLENIGVPIPSTDSGAKLLELETWGMISWQDALALLTTAFLIDRFFLFSRYTWKYGLKEFAGKYIAMIVAALTYIFFSLGAHFGVNLIPQYIINPAFDVAFIISSLVISRCAKTQISNIELKNE